MADSSSPPWHKSIAVAFVLLILGTAAMGVVVMKRGVQIETDLQSISPHYIEDAAVETAVDQLAQALQQNLSLVIKSDSREAIEHVLDVVPELIPGLELKYLQYIDGEERLARVVETIRQNRFYLLTDAQLTDLQTLDDAALLQQARRQLYSITGSARFFSVGDDPLGMANGYTLNLLDKLPGSGREDIIAVRDNDGEFYYAPLNFMLLPNAQDFQQQAFVQQEIAQVERALNDVDPKLRILHSGVFFFSANAATSAKADITVISTGSTAGILLLLLYFFRSARTLLLPLISIAAGVGFAFLASQLLFGAIHIFTIVFGASLIGVVIDYALHYAYHHNKEGDNKSLNNLYRALLLSLMTSAIGYGALSFSGLAVLQQVAVFSILGLLSAWITVLSLGQVLLPKTQTLHDDGLRKLIALTSNACQKIPAKPFAITYMLTIAAGLGLVVTQSDTSDSPRGFFEADPQLLAEEAELQPILSNLEPAIYMVIRGQNEQAIYDQLRALWQQHPEQQQALFGAHTVMASPQQRQQVYQANGRLYETGALASRFLRDLDVAPATIENLVSDFQQAQASPPSGMDLLDGEGLPTPPLWQQIDQYQYSFFLLSRQADFTALKNFAGQRDAVYFIDSVGMSTSAIQTLRQSANLLLLFALALVSVLMLMRYRKLASLSLMAVPVAAIVLTLAVFAISGIAVTLFHVMALFLVLGLGMDYVIFIADLHRGNQNTLCAVVLSAMTSLLAFGLLSLSQLPVVHAFGLTVLIGNSINVAGGFMLARFLSAPPRESRV